MFKPAGTEPFSILHFQSPILLQRDGFQKGSTCKRMGDWKWRIENDLELNSQNAQQVCLHVSPLI